MPLSNDDRGWIMTALSGVACVVGASFICVDLIIRLLPGKRNFRIQDSDAFLSISLSLSFGVMLFSALYSILPSSKRSLEAGGFTPRNASLIMIGCFLAGVIGIQILSRALHHYIPHNVVNCEHEHEDEEAPKEQSVAHADHHHGNGPNHDHSHPQMQETNSRRGPNIAAMSRPQTNRAESHQSHFGQDHNQASAQSAESERNHRGQRDGASARTPTFQLRIARSITQLASGADSDCDCEGPCYGYRDLCQQACFRNVNARGGAKSPAKPSNGSNRPATTKSIAATESTPLLHDVADNALTRPKTTGAAEGLDGAHNLPPSDETAATTFVTGHDHHNHDHDHDAEPDHHHHHVPTNAFLSIGLQTSIAIALHKLPEGFITYATNHANPQLGFSVFLALFMHNITEGFAMALPLYLAINSRIKAILISFVLGGLSQPIGAGVAALWFRLAGNGKYQPDESIYGGMFAITAGIMASVALQLFSESLDLTHSKNLCMIGAFTGMTILGVSSALSA